MTDGWYRVQGLVDFEMNMLLHKGIVKVGTKLIIYNAELIGAGGGIDPLEVSTFLNSLSCSKKVLKNMKITIFRNYEKI